MNENVAVAFILTLFAGLSTGIGSAIALYAKQTNTKFLSIALGFSAGVMIYVSFVEIFPTALAMLSKIYGKDIGTLIAVISFFMGMFFIASIDKLIPNKNNQHETNHAESPGKISKTKARLMRTGLYTAMAIAIHNFPEGLATFMTALSSPEIALPLVIAIALHNIPEGIAVAVPIYHATGDRKKAFVYSFLSGLAEPLGALIGYTIFMPFLNEAFYGAIFAAVAGIMVFISIDELLPSAREYGKHRLSIHGMVSGMMLMALSLILLT